MESLDRTFFDLANLFNRNQILSFIKTTNYEKWNSLVYTLELKRNLKKNLTYSEVFDSLYNVLKNNYKCEYIYLNEIFLQELLKEHEINPTIITEFNVNSSKADLVIVNGTTTVYEIKTELDTLNRLEKQLLDYIKVFERVYIITYEKNVDEIKKFLKIKFSLKKVGIKILKNNGDLETIKKSGSFIKDFDKEFIFKCLIKKERDFFDKDYYIAKEKFLKKSKIYIHEYFKKCLLERKKDIDFIETLPKSLKMIGHKLQNTLNKSQKEAFYIKLTKKINF